MPDDELIHALSLPVGQLDVAFEWWGYKVHNESVPTRTVVRFEHSGDKHEFEADDQLWVTGSIVRSAVLAYLAGAHRHATNATFDRVQATLRAAHNGKLPGERRTA